MSKAINYLIICLTVLVLLSACEGGPQSDRFHILMTFDVNGVERRATIYPSVDNTRPAPAIFYFHGNGGSATDYNPTIRFHELWPEAVVIYAEGTDLDSNGIQPDGSLSWELRFPYKADLSEGRAQVNDLAFVDRLLDHIATDHDVDRDRIFAAGHSSGGFFTFSLMEHRADVFTGFAVLGAFAGYKVAQINSGNPAINGNVRIVSLGIESDRAQYPRPVYYLFGDGDTVFDGNNPKPNLNGFDPNGDCWAGRTLTQLLFRNRIEPPAGLLWAKPGVTTFASPANGAIVRYHLYNGTHSWPSDANEWVIDWFQSL